MYDTFNSEGFNPFKENSVADLNHPKRGSYLTQIEKANNPNVGPGSYNPVVQPKAKITQNPIWQKAPERFKSIETRNSKLSFPSTGTRQ